MLQPTLSGYEKRLLQELAELGERIQKLEQERDVLQRMLAKARIHHRVVDTVERKNSVSRLLVETVILEALGASEGPMRSAELLTRLRRMVPDLKDTTFRSYLYRMKAQGMIENYRGQRGRWIACDAGASVDGGEASPS